MLSSKRMIAKHSRFEALERAERCARRAHRPESADGRAPPRRRQRRHVRRRRAERAPGGGKEDPRAREEGDRGDRSGGRHAPHHHDPFHQAPRSARVRTRPLNPDAPQRPTAQVTRRRMAVWRDRRARSLLNDVSTGRDSSLRRKKKKGKTIGRRPRGIQEDGSSSTRRRRFKYFRMAADRGYACAQLNLAGCFCDGLGVSVDQNKLFFKVRARI